MNDNNEYYAEKMRRLLENKESRESIKLDDSRKTALVFYFCFKYFLLASSFSQSFKTPSLLRFSFKQG